jgi:hypothetical protein
VLKGVYEAKKKNGTIYYRSSFTYKGKHISLGSFDTEKDANKAYDEALYCSLKDSVTINMYSDKWVLPFEKMVIIINLRDNGIYFGTPIYVRSKFFYYYYSLDYVLKFDIDELFYYSSHKIMKRNGHLFVADYGMQVNILNRYGIKNHAAKGKDYVFINGDDTDFRRENIQIINNYFGVDKTMYRGKEKYRARINIPNYYTIGYYNSETESAIAYNKAIDILKKNGVTKNYTPNYIEGISPSLYADIYSKLKISDKINHYSP